MLLFTIFTVFCCRFEYINFARFCVQPGDLATAGKASRTSVQKKDGKVFFTSPRVKTQSAEDHQPTWPYRSGKIVLKSSAKSGRKKQPTEPSWLDDDDVFSFHAED